MEIGGRVGKPLDSCAEGAGLHSRLNQIKYFFGFFVGMRCVESVNRKPNRIRDFSKIRNRLGLSKTKNYRKPTINNRKTDEIGEISGVACL